MSNKDVKIIEKDALQNKLIETDHEIAEVSDEMVKLRNEMYHQESLGKMSGLRVITEVSEERETLLSLVRKFTSNNEQHKKLLDTKSLIEDDIKRLS